jgi:hypothetical protein
VTVLGFVVTLALLGAVRWAVVPILFEPAARDAESQTAC